jgi:hypothetical protein
MAKDSQTESLTLQDRYGATIYRTNPSVPAPDAINTRNKRIRIGDEKKGFVVDGLGEVVGNGVAAFYEFEEVESTRFVKLFFDGVKQVSGLSKTGLRVFEAVFRQMQDNPNKDEIMLSYAFVRDFNPDMTERTYNRSLKELLDREILFRSLINGVFFVNIRYLFNGDRLAFVKGYKRKAAKPDDKQLSLFDAAPDALPASEGEE